MAVRVLLLAGFAAAAALLGAAAARAQSSATISRCVPGAGPLGCAALSAPRFYGGGHAYERWSDGSAAMPSSGSFGGGYSFPQYVGGHNAIYGFGR